MKKSIGVKLFFIVCLFCFSRAQPLAINWNEIHHVQQSLIEWYGDRSPVNEYEPTINQLNILLELQEQEAKNNLSGELRENMSVSKEILQEFVHTSHGLNEQLESTSSNEQERLEKKEKLHLFDILSGLIHLGKNHLARNQHYFTTPHVLPVPHSGGQPPYYHGSNQPIIFPSFDLKPLNRWSTMEKMVAVCGGTLLAYILARTYFNGVIERKIAKARKDIENGNDQREKLLSEVRQIRDEGRRWETKYAQLKKTVDSIEDKIKQAGRDLRNSHTMTKSQSLKNLRTMNEQLSSFYDQMKRQVNEYGDQAKDFTTQIKELNALLDELRRKYDVAQA